MQVQQQQMIAHQRHQQAARQAMLAQQYSGVPIGIQNGMNQMTPAQFQAMRGGPMARPVNLPQHLQAQQQQAVRFYSYYICFLKARFFTGLKYIPGIRTSPPFDVQNPTMNLY
jgi:hypothetical protein